MPAELAGSSTRAVLESSAARRSRRVRAGQARVLAMIAGGHPLSDVLAELVRTVEAYGGGMLGSVLLVDADGTRLRLGAAPRLPRAYSRAVDGVPIGPASGSCGTAAYRGRRVIVKDLSTDPLWKDYRDIALRHGLRACWSQPIFSTAGEVLGTFALYYRKPGGPERRDVELIEAAAHLAGIAIERSRADEKQRAVERRLRRQGATLAELAKSDELAREDFRGFARLVTEKAADTLGVERVSLWLFSPNRETLRCEDLYERGSKLHSRGTELESTRYPRYFAALGRGRVVAAHDARTSPATREFRNDYLEPLGITSMLDAPLRRAGSLIGVVCHEHVGPPRVWAPEEQEFAASIAEFVALALETSERRRAEEAFRTAQNELLLHQQQERQLVDAELERVKGDLVQQTRFATLGQVAVSIAHELRNPLAALQNAAYFLRRRAPAGDEKWSQYLDILDHEVLQADRIVNELLEMSRERAPGKRETDLARLVREAWEYVPDRSRVELRVSLEPPAFPVLADPDQIRQVFANLLTNSVQAVGEESGTITVCAVRDGAFDVITVADNGPGIPGPLRRRIFDPLFTTKAKGTGLGLAICRQIVERHGGTIELAESVRGAVFCLRLPTAGRSEDSS